MRPPSFACGAAPGAGTDGVTAAGRAAGGALAAAGLAAGAAAFAGAGEGGAGAGAVAAAPPVASITPTTVWIGTVWPSLTLISFSTPEGEGISASTLSVEISKSGSSRSTLSPGFLSHLVIVPSKIDSPIWGITTSVGMDSLSDFVADECCVKLCAPSVSGAKIDYKCVPSIGSRRPGNPTG